MSSELGYQTLGREPLSRTGSELSLVIVHGKLQNMLQWVNDATKPTIETGVIQLDELRHGRVKDIVRDLRDRWPAQAAALEFRIEQLALSWALAAPAERQQQLDWTIAEVHFWLVELGRAPL